ncbi:MAG: hypothetical protein CL483_07600 [Acidobacteria bacterium]|nr:hypothetical protein [Acidobacteriota bacterium]
MRIWGFVIWLLGVATVGLGAQANTGEIGGLVVDGSGGVLPGATIVASHPDSGLRVERVTDSQGRFFLPALPTGRWEVVAELPGFQRAVQRGITLEIGRTLELEFALTLGAVSEEVVVEVTAPLLQVTTAEISDVIETREVEQIPLNGRQFLQLAQLSDAVVIPPGGTRGAALQQAGPLPNVGGQRAGHNIYLLDGFKVTDELFNNLVINPSVDSIQEFKIQKSMYPPEFGGKASALINVATKSGANRFSGSLFEFVRDERFDAHNFFDDRSLPVPPLDQHQYGGSFGGPIVPDRTFFFVSYERQDTKRSLTKTFSVPTSTLRSGDFTGWDSICDPSTIDAGTGACAPFPGNRIPADRLDPIAQAFLANVPLPNGTGEFQNLTSVEQQDKDVHQFSVRVDHRLTDTQQMFVRFSTFDADEIQPFGTSVQQESLVPGFGRSLDTTTRNLGVSHTKTFGVSMLNEFRFGYMSVDGGQRSANAGFDFAGNVGLLGVSRNPRDVGFPQISTGGLFSTMGDPTTFVSRDNEHLELYNNFLIDRGAHRFKFGGYLFHLKFRPLNADTARGAFSYTGQWTGNALADLLLGFPTSARSGVGGGDEDARTTWLHLYAQDDWRVRDNLTINYGLRYEYNAHMKDVDNELSSIDLSVPGGRFVIASDDQGNISSDAQALLPLIPIPWVTSSEIGWERSLLRPSKVRLAPRTGFALSLGEERPAVIRGGYGIFLNQWAYSVQTAFSRNLPFFFLKQVDAPSDQLVPSLQTRNILSSDSTGSIGGTIMDNDYQVEYTQTWSGGVQIEAFPRTMLEVLYMGSYTLGADNSTIRNVPEPGPGPIDARRPIPQLSAIRAIRFDGKSIYHALTFKAERRFDGRFSFNAAYTLSRSLDDASSPGATAFESNVPQDVRNIFPGEEALSSFDRRHQLVASGSYQLPFFERAGGTAELLAAGWRLNAILTVQSGAPFTVNLAQDIANIGSGPFQRPDRIGDPNLSAGQRSATEWFNTAAFALQAPFTFGSAPRNSVFAPGFAVVDLSVQKDWQVNEGRLQFRWEIFNLLNRANFDVPNRIFGTPNFGRIFSAQNAREMQFGLRYSF